MQGIFCWIFWAVAAIEQFTANIEFEEFSQNPEKVFAFSRKIEITGAAVKQIPDLVRNQHPDIPCVDITGMWDGFIDNYSNTDVAIR